MADKIKDYLIQQKTGKLAPAYLAKLEKDADVQIPDADLKAAVAAAEAATVNAPARDARKVRWRRSGLAKFARSNHFANRYENESGKGCSHRGLYRTGHCLARH